MQVPVSHTFLHFAFGQRSTHSQYHIYRFWGIFGIPASVLSALQSMSPLSPLFLNNFRRAYYCYLQNVLIMLQTRKYKQKTTDPLCMSTLTSNKAVVFLPTSFAQIN